jgi:hypothetical protein
MKEESALPEADYTTSRQRHSPGIVEFRWTNAGGEILGHRNERLIADLREALHYRAACPESFRSPSLWQGRSFLAVTSRKVPRLLRLRTGS